MDDRILIYETPHWRIHLQHLHAYLCQSIIFLKRAAPSLSDVNDEKWEDFQQNVVKKIESAIKKAFGADPLNWACLMNYAYREDAPHPQVHWHLISRYKTSKTFDGLLLHDREFGDHYLTDPSNISILPKKTQLKIAEEIRKNLR